MDTSTTGAPITGTASASHDGAPKGRHRQPGDGWVECSCGLRHWGLNGAAGVALFRIRDGRAREIVLQHRAPWSDFGDLWGVPGGAVRPDETPVQGALRETFEEAGVPPEDVQVIGEHVVDHGPWQYTTAVAVERDGSHVDPTPTDAESVDVRWEDVDSAPNLPLLPAFAHALPQLLAIAQDWIDSRVKSVTSGDSDNHSR